MTTPLDLNALHLDKGSHSDRADGLCLLEAAAWWAGEEHNDNPACVSIVLGGFGSRLNDVLPDGRRQELVRFVPLLPGTRGDDLDEARSYLALDWLVRAYTPAFLDLLPELAGVAAELRGLPPIMDMVTAGAVGPTLRSAQEQARAARVAAWDVVWNAAWVAAGDAAWAAAWDAAAWAAARAAAWDAAWDAAWAAAGDAAWAAARAAAGDAAWAAAGDAAGDAAGSALQPTIDKLQTSAIDLYARMINPAAVTA